MKRRFTEVQIIGFLKKAEAGMPVKELCRKHGFSDASFYTWRAQFGGMEVSEARRLKDLEAENEGLTDGTTGRSHARYGSADGASR